MIKEEFIEECKKLNINITEELYNKLKKYYNLLLEWNNKFNMTAITKEEDVFLLHFYDSLCLTKAIDLNKKLSLCDFGTGAGFPGLVLAIVFNEIDVTLIESNQKKCMFLEVVKKELGLQNVNIINDRMELYSKKSREIYDVITCRAVTSIPIILELSSSSLKVGGYLVPLKSNCNDEIKKYNYLKNKLSLKLIDKIEYNLPINEAFRMIPIYKKINYTNLKYPRNYNIIIKEYKNN